MLSSDQDRSGMVRVGQVIFKSGYVEITVSSDSAQASM